MNPYPEEIKENIVEQAMFCGLLEAAKFNNIAPQSLVHWLKRRGISLKRETATSNCVVCGVLFKHYKKQNRVCCSLKCRKIHTTVTRKCAYCNNEFEVIKSKIQKYCSHKCYGIDSRKESHEPKRRGSNWGTIRRIFKKNPCLCKVCKTEKAVDLHHIIPYKYFKGEWKRANDKLNLVELCQKCHVRAENRVRKTFKIIEYVEAMA